MNKIMQVGLAKKILELRTTLGDSIKRSLENDLIPFHEFTVSLNPMLVGQNDLIEQAALFTIANFVECPDTEVDELAKFVSIVVTPSNLYVRLPYMFHKYLPGEIDTAIGIFDILEESVLIDEINGSFFRVNAAVDRQDFSDYNEVMAFCGRLGVFIDLLGYDVVVHTSCTISRLGTLVDNGRTFNLSVDPSTLPNMAEYVTKALRHQPEHFREFTVNLQSVSFEIMVSGINS